MRPSLYAIWSPVNNAWLTIFHEELCWVGPERKRIWNKLEDLREALRQQGLRLVKEGDIYAIKLDVDNASTSR